MNPIIHRELIGLLRTSRALALEISLALACALLVLLRWPTGGVADLSGARALEVLRLFGYTALAGILFIVPAVPASGLIREKVKGTLALLLTSPLSGFSIYVGKLCSSLGFMLILLMMTVPAAAACYALGGTPLRGGVLLLYGVIVLAGFQVATLGLLVSSRCQSTDSALRVTYALVLALCVLPLGPQWLFHQGDGGILEVAASWFRNFSPIPALLETLGQGDIGSHGMTAGGGAIVRYAIMAGLMSLACALATIAKLNHVMLDRARPPGVMTEDRSGDVRFVRRLFFLVDPRRRSRGIGRFTNPIMAKEFRSRRFGRSHWTLRLIALSAILSLALSYMAAGGALGWGIDVIGGALVLLQIALLILFAPSLAAGLISSERESGGWQLLRMTPLAPGRILRGKLYSVAWPLLLLLFATLPGYIVMMSVKPDLAYQMQQVVASLVLTAIFAVLVSAAISSLFRSTAAATTVSYLVLLIIFLGPLLIWLGRGAPFGRGTVEMALTLSPVAAALQAAETPGFRDYQLLPNTWWLIGSASIALLIFLSARVWQLYKPE
jgi:ABC-type transport system involved in multi-copper enzyme maturation permease subunit